MEDEKYQFCGSNIFTNMNKNVKRPGKDIIELKQNFSEISKNMVILQRQSFIPRRIQIKKHLTKRKPNNLNRLANRFNSIFNKNKNYKVLITDPNEKSNNDLKKIKLSKQFETKNKKILGAKENKSQIFLINLNKKKSDNSPETAALKISLSKCDLPIIPKSNVQILDLELDREISSISSSETSNQKSSRELKMPIITKNYRDNISKSIENFVTKNSEFKSDLRKRQSINDCYNEIFREKVSNNQKRFFKKCDTNVDIFNNLNELCKNDFSNKFKFSYSTEDLINNLKDSISNKRYNTESVGNGIKIIDNEGFLKIKSKLLKKSLKQINQRILKEKEKEKKIKGIIIDSKNCLSNIDLCSLKNKC